MEAFARGRGGGVEEGRGGKEEGGGETDGVWAVVEGGVRGDFPILLRRFLGVGGMDAWMHACVLVGCSLLVE